MRLKRTPARVIVFINSDTLSAGLVFSASAAACPSRQFHKTSRSFAGPVETSFKSPMPCLMARRNALPSCLPVIAEGAAKCDGIHRRSSSLPSCEEPLQTSTSSTSTDEESVDELPLQRNSWSESMFQPVERYKLSVVGDSQSGKTCLLKALIKSDFELEESCIFDECVTDIMTRDGRLEFMLWDCSGLDDYDNIRREMYRDTDVFLVCFDIGRPASLESVVSKWIPEVKEVCPGVPYLLIGCKNDLRTESALRLFLTVPGQDVEEPDSVNRLKAVSVAHTEKARSYVECCAKTRWHVKEVFKAAADAILQKDEEKTDTAVKPQSMLRRFSARFSVRRSSSPDVSECNAAAVAYTRNRRLSLFTSLGEG